MNMSHRFAAVAVLKDDLVSGYYGRALLDLRRSGDGVGIGSRVVKQGITFDINWLASSALRAQSVQLCF
jgi:hypothetical protein